MSLRVYAVRELADVANDMRALARVTPPYDGRESAQWIVAACRSYHMPTCSLTVFCRDADMHACGWFKNPDWDRCFHLSLSFRSPHGQPMPHDHAVARQWVDHLFRDDARYLWVESPYSDDGKRLGVHHYRVMCDPAWQPIIPRGEPYTKAFTEAGWKSWSDQRAAEAQS